MNKLIEAYEEYIALLEKECGSLNVMSYIHGGRTDPADIKKGEECREKIAQLKSDLTKEV